MPKLHLHIGFASRRRVFRIVATLAALLVVVGVGMYFYRMPPEPARKEETAFQPIPGLPEVLSQADLSLYHKAFALEKAGQTKAANEVLAKVSDTLLRGELLGERYLDSDDDVSFSEIALWLARYGDHPQAGELYRMAQDLTPDNATFLTEPQSIVTFKSFSQRHDKSALAGEKHWVSGLQAYHEGHMVIAANHFKGLVEGDRKLSSDDRSAAAFWAYRASRKAGNKAEAAKYLSQAASEPPSFYSILARQVSDDSQDKTAGEQEQDNTAFLSKEPVRRAIALKTIGEDELAEQELHALFLASKGGEHARVVELARALNLPGVQMQMAVSGAYDPSSSNALYPVPHWKPTLGYRVEPALLFAIMRQESGFNPNAKSASGATGVMQLMPATADAMARDARLKLGEGPAVSMALGQHYIERLMDTDGIDDNLIYILAAYNAGPGNVINWQKNHGSEDDPLLFIESIPNAQSRDYVVHVMGNYWVYSEILGGYENRSAEVLAQNRWPHYERSEKQMALMLSHLAGGSE